MDAIEVLFRERDTASDALSVASRRIERFQLFRALLLLTLAGLVLNHAFVKPEFEIVKSEFAVWRVKFAPKREWLSPLKTSEVSLETQASRKAVLELNEVKAVLQQFKGHNKMAAISSKLIQDTYQFTPTTLDDFVAAAEKFKRKHAGKTLAQLKEEEFTYRIWPMSRKMTRYEELENLANQHVAIKLTAGEEDTASAAIEDLLEQAKRLREKWGTSIEAWEDVSRRVPKWSSWTLAAFQSYTDADAREWNQLLERLVAYKLDWEQLPDKNKPFGVSVQALEDAVEKEEEAIQKEKERVSLWSVPITIPKRLLTLFFPFLFVLSICALQMLKLFRTTLRIRVAELNRKLREFTGVETLGSAGNEVLNSASPLSYVSNRRWAALFDNSPHLFSDIFYQIATLAMAGYLLWRWCTLVFVDLRALIEWWNVWWGIAVFIFLFGFTIPLLWISNRICHSVLSTARRVANDRLGVAQSSQEGLTNR